MSAERDLTALQSLDRSGSGLGCNRAIENVKYLTLGVKSSGRTRDMINMIQQGAKSRSQYIKINSPFK